jgi:hypothetical protein
VHVVADLPADPQTAEVVQEREGTLDNPSLSAQAGAVFGVAACDQWPDAEFAYQSPVLVVVVSAVGEDHVGASAGPAARAPYRRHGFQQRDELVTSLQLPPVSVNASGIPVPSVIRWCLLPVLPRSTGLRPVVAPPLGL